MLLSACEQNCVCVHDSSCVHMVVAVCCSVLQCAAVCCSVLQCVAVCCTYEGLMVWGSYE